MNHWTLYNHFNLKLSALQGISIIISILCYIIFSFSLISIHSMKLDSNWEKRYFKSTTTIVHIEIFAKFVCIFCVFMGLNMVIKMASTECTHTHSQMYLLQATTLCARVLCMCVMHDTVDGLASYMLRFIFRNNPDSQSIIEQMPPTLCGLGFTVKIHIYRQLISDGMLTMEL